MKDRWLLLYSVRLQLHKLWETEEEIMVSEDKQQKTEEGTEIYYLERVENIKANVKKPLKFQR